MLFNSVHFLVFAPIVISVFFLIPARFRNAWLLIVSLYFYAVFRVPFLAVLLFSIGTTHFAAKGIFTAKTPRMRKVYLGSAIIVNVSLLYFLKYIDFSFRAFNQLFGLGPCDPLFAAPTGVILPMGISFFALQAMAYAVDVYRGEIPPAKNVFHFALFKSFFPQLVAGPIMRAKHLLHQFQEEKRFHIENLEAGIRLIAIGVLKKTLIADPVGHVVDDVFNHQFEYNWASMLLGGFLHGLQVYGDFSGYSDMAIGTARILGFQIPDNFLRPYLSDSLTDLWRRWHISLSTWLRDYVYIPLGGSRVSLPRSYVNLFITWFFTGLWHGADWTFLLWGMTHAVFISLERWLLSSESRTKIFYAIPRPVRTFYAVGVFSIAAVFFRARPVQGFTEGAGAAFSMLERAFTFAPGKMLVLPGSIVAAIGLLLFIEVMQEWKADLLSRIAENRIMVNAMAVAVLIVGFFVYSVSVSTQFIYFQF